MGISHAGFAGGRLAGQPRARISILGTDSSSFLFSQATGSKNPRITGGSAVDLAAGDYIRLMEREHSAVVEQCGGETSFRNHVARHWISTFFCGTKNKTDLPVPLVHQYGLRLEFLALSFGPHYYTSSVSAGKNIAHTRR